MRMIDVDTLERIPRDIFIAWKAPREDAAWIASLLVRANLRGHDSHAVAVPGPNGTVARSHDFATSVVAEGKPKVKFNRGEKVAPGIMRNGRGEPSTDPREYYADPPGSLITAGEHNGYGLFLAVEILGGILSGTGPARPDKGPVSNRRRADRGRDVRQIKACATEVGVDA